MSAPTPSPHRLLVLRHAKSSWGDDGLDDHERPLAPRGRRAAEAMAGHVAGRGPAPDLVLCSTARRAIETLDHLRPLLPDHTVLQIEDGLYGAPAVSILERLRSVPEETTTVLVVGHNPGLEDLVRGLVRDGSAALLLRVRVKYPTGALATISFAGAWCDLGPGTATLEDFVVPSELG